MMLSVCMITYNHEKFIREAIESVIQQKTEFDIELVIGEDFSTDNTKMFCQGYSDRHSKRIRLLDSEKKLGIIPNFIRTLEACTGKYIALCEGDDYWTDPCKLQKQVDFLESNFEYSLCFHNALIKWEGIPGEESNFCNSNQKTVTSINDVIKNHYIPTASMVFRRDSLHIPYWFKDIYNGDYALQLILADKGKIYYLNKVMSVYRRTINSLSGSYSTSENVKRLIFLFRKFNELTNRRYAFQINKRLVLLRMMQIKKWLKSKYKNCVSKTLNNLCFNIG